VPKAKTPITLPKTLKKTPTKALAKAVVIEEVKEVVIHQNSRGYTITLPKRFKHKNQ
jgi:hypothetical protein